MIFADRRRRTDPHLEWKVRLFSVAAVFVIGGIYFEARWMTGVAIALLAGALLLRLLTRDHAVEPDDEDDGAEPAGP